MPADTRRHQSNVAAAPDPAARRDHEPAKGHVPSCALGVPIFQILPDDALVELGGVLRHRRYDKGGLVALTGDSVRHLILVAHGRLKVVHSTPGGREQVVRSLGPGEFVGELALFTPTLHEGDLVAQEPTEVCLVPREAVQSLMRRHPEVALRLVEVLARRLAAAEHVVADLGLRDVGQRLAAELLRLADSGTPTQEGIRIQIAIPWVETARRLGTTPESLSRRLKELTKLGIIHQESARKIVVVKPDRLRQLATA